MERLIIQDSEGRRAGAVDIQAVVGAYAAETFDYLAVVAPGDGTPIRTGFDVIILTDLPRGSINDRSDTNRDVALARVDHILAAIDAGHDPESDWDPERFTILVNQAADRRHELDSDPE